MFICFFDFLFYTTKIKFFPKEKLKTLFDKFKFDYPTLTIPTDGGLTSKKKVLASKQNFFFFFPPNFL